jgi:CheY-like chemotaxis protein
MNRGLVLLVEGDLDTRLALGRQLDALGWQALAVNTGSEALRVADQEVHFEVLLSAITLSDMDGRDLATAICRWRPFTRVVLTGGSHELTAASEAGAVLVKPIETVALGRALSAASPWRPLRLPRVSTA